ncbi:hypothetical protein DERP_011861 [Dermatophagoides pteronyssinus]|uniref:Phospholipid scramblase n=1 Tax=Dermatophagoides pteronyssinus TaxID=6956 RepID=A0ABQ8JRW7_DERPT|nr:hypothetical protein DERP_011861 [Dermatophagoides pteronyssinus]
MVNIKCEKIFKKYEKENSNIKSVNSLKKTKIIIGDSTGGIFRLCNCLFNVADDGKIGDVIVRGGGCCCCCCIVPFDVGDVGVDDGSPINQSINFIKLTNH